MANTKEIIRVKQIGSPIRRNSKQRLYLKSLGLKRMNQERELEKSSSIEALVKKLPHLVKVIG